MCKIQNVYIFHCYHATTIPFIFLLLLINDQNFYFTNKFVKCYLQTCKFKSLSSNLSSRRSDFDFFFFFPETKSRMGLTKHRFNLVYQYFGIRPFAPARALAPRTVALGSISWIVAPY